MEKFLLILAFGISSGWSQCIINLDNILTDPPPMLVDRNNRIIYPENGNRLLTIAENGQIALFCHGTAKRSSKVDKTYTPVLEASTSYVPLTCSKGSFLYDVNKGVVDVHTAVCTARHQPEMAKNYNLCSSIGADGRTSGLEQIFSAQIAWNISGTWTNQIEVCADDKVYGSLWVKYTLRGKSIDLRDLTPGRPVFRTDTTSENRFFSKTTTTGVTNAYTKASEADMVSKLLGTNNTLYGTNTVIIDTVTGSNYLARGHLAPDANFIYNLEQDATYYFMNVVPQFQSFNNGNWKSLESVLRKYASNKQKDITVYTGTVGVLSYPNSSGVLTPIYLMDLSSQLYIPVPKYIWTMLYNPDAFEAILFIGLNNPYAGSNTGLNFCTSVCAELTWITRDFNTTEKGAFQCCKIDQELKNRIPTIPNLSDVNNNWPTLIKSL